MGSPWVQRFLSSKRGGIPSGEAAIVCTEACLCAPLCTLVRSLPGGLTFVIKHSRQTSQNDEDEQEEEAAAAGGVVVVVVDK